MHEQGAMSKPDPSFFAPSTHRCVGGLQLECMQIRYTILSLPFFACNHIVHSNNFASTLDASSARMSVRRG